MTAITEPASPVCLDPLGADHHGEASRLRSRGPVARVELPGGVAAWAVTHYDALGDLVRDPRISKDWRKWSAVREDLLPENWSLTGVVKVNNMFSADGEEHRRLRTAVTNVLTPLSVRALQPRLDQIVESLIRDLPQHVLKDGSVDLCRSFANLLPLNVISELLGVPGHLRPRLQKLTAMVFDHSVEGAEVSQTQSDILDAMAELVAYRTVHPGSDLISALVAARQADPNLLSEEELFSTAWLVASAGWETTRSLIINAQRALLKHPAQHAVALAGNEETWEAVVEETLRWDGPVGNILTRVALEDITIGDVTIPAGDAIVAPYSAVGRDVLRHGESADKFDITRIDKRHMAFGGGPHFCPGALLARREALTALPALNRAYPKMRLAVDDSTLPPIPSILSNSVLGLPVFLKP